MSGSRNDNICEDYKDKNIPELARSYGLSQRRIEQVLVENNVTLRKRPRKAERKPITRLHERIGRMVYDYRFDRGIEPVDMANEIGWSIIKLRRVEQGLAPLELLDLQNIASYTGVRLAPLIEG